MKETVVALEEQRLVQTGHAARKAGNEEVGSPEAVCRDHFWKHRYQGNARLKSGHTSRKVLWRFDDNPGISDRERHHQD